MRWGAWEGRRLAELRAALGQAMRENEARGWDFRPPGGESPREVLARVRPWLAEVAARGEPTLAVTHRGVIRAVLAHALEWDLRGKPPAKLDWAAAQVFRLAADGHPAVEALNVR
jgi:probable phosphoglycerate mutase